MITLWKNSRQVSFFAVFFAEIVVGTGRAFTKIRRLLGFHSKQGVERALH